MGCGWGGYIGREEGEGRELWEGNRGKAAPHGGGGEREETRGKEAVWCVQPRCETQCEW